ncbi:MAG: hypothetical protein AAF726_00800 [Planctomycetota bacterium]
MRRLAILATFTFMGALTGCITPPPMEPYRGSPPPSERVQDPVMDERGVVRDVEAAPQDPRGTYDPPPAAPPEPQKRPVLTQAGLVFGRDAAWLHARVGFPGGTLIDGGLFFGEEDTVFNIGALRTGQPRPDSPLTLGAGLGFYGGELRGPLDFFGSVVLTGMAHYVIETTYPVKLKGQVSAAPDATTFGDANSLIDALFSIELELASNASIIVGYRFFEIGIPNQVDLTLQNSALVGVRLGF